MKFRDDPDIMDQKELTCRLKALPQEERDQHEPMRRMNLERVRGFEDELNELRQKVKILN